MADPKQIGIIFHRKINDGTKTGFAIAALMLKNRIFLKYCAIILRQTKILMHQK